jgi:hypothetical protein
MSRFDWDAPGRRAIHVSHSETITALDPVGSKPWMGTGTAHPHTVGAPMRDVVRHDERLPVSQDIAGDEAEQRRAARFTLLIRAAKLASPDGEYLCVVRDASQTGVSVRLFHPLPADVPLTLELQNGDRHPLERVWEEEGKAGFRFEGTTDIARIVESPSRFAKRAVRVNLGVPCTIRVGDRKVVGKLINLSQQGAQIAMGEHLSLVQRIKLEADGLPEIAAKVRWRRKESYGLSFEDNFQFSDLARIVFDLQHGPPARKARAG